MRWFFIPAVLLGLCFGSSVVAEGPAPLSIDGPNKAAIGELIVLTAVAKDAVEIGWEIDPVTPNFLPVDGGTRAVFCSPMNGRTVVFCASTTAEGKLFHVQHVVTIGPPEPTPPVPPEPGPPEPIPPEPDPTPSGWVKWSMITATSKVAVEGRSEAAVILADTMDSIVAAAKAGSYECPPGEVCRVSPERKAREAMRQATNLDLGKEAKNWMRYNAALESAVGPLVQSGKMRTLEQWCDLWTQLAEGLRKVP